MDSVISSNENEQEVANVGQRKLISVATDKFEEDFGDDHHRLLFGGVSSSPSESQSDSGLIVSAAKLSSSGQRARDNSADLNLVNISGINSGTGKSDTRPAVTNDTNPLPVLAKTGVAATVSLQSPTSDNAIPAGRRSVSRDSIAQKLDSDSTPPPLLPQEIKLSQLDSGAAKLASARAVNNLFERLGSPPPEGRDENCRPAASTRRAAEPLMNAGISLAGGAVVPDTRTNPAGSTRQDSRAAELRAEAAYVAPLKTNTDSRQPGAVSGTSSMFAETGTVFGARPRNNFEPQGNQDSPIPSARPRSTQEENGAPDIQPLARINGGKIAVDGLSAATAILDPTNNQRLRNVPDLSGTPDSGPLPVRLPSRQTSDSPGTNSGPPAEVNNGTRRSAESQRANIPSEPLPLGTKGYPTQVTEPIRTATSLPLAGVSPHGSILPEILLPAQPRNQRGPLELGTNDTTGTTGSRLGEATRGLAVNGMGSMLPEKSGADRGNSGERPSAGDRGIPGARPLAQPETVFSAPNRDTKQAVAGLLSPGTEPLIAPVVNRNGSQDRITTNNDAPGAPRKDGAVPPTGADCPPIIHGTMYVPNGTQLPTGLKPDTTPKDGQYRPNSDTGVGGVIKTAANAGDQIVQSGRQLVDSVLSRPDQPGTGIRPEGQRDARTNDGVLPSTLPGIGRNSDTSPTAKPIDGTNPTTRPLEPGTIHGGKVVDTNLPGTATLPRAGDPVASGDRGVVRTPDGRIADVVRNGDNPSRPGDPAQVGRNGETVTRNGETVSRNGETIARNGETIARNGETVARNGETIARNGETIRAIDATGKTVGDVNQIAKASDGITKVDGITRTDAVAKIEAIAKADNIVKTEGTVKTEGAARTESGAKIADASIKVADGTKLVDAVKAVDGVKVADGAKALDVTGKQVEVQVKANSDVANLSGKQLEVAAKIGEVAAVQKGLDLGVKIANEAIIKNRETVVRASEQTSTTRGQDLIANVKLADAIVKVADQSVKALESNQPIKLDSVVRSSDQNIQNASLTAAMQGNQIAANNQQQGKSDGVRNDANAANRAGEQYQVQNPIGQQNQLGIQNQIAQNNNAAIGPRDQGNQVIQGNQGIQKDQVVVQGIKQNNDSPTPGQKNIDVKVDQVVADILNHVRNNKDQQLGAKILSSLDQNNVAANQQLVPQGLLDAAAVRRILDGQGVTLSPSALNTIMEGIKPTGDHAVDYALPSIGSLNLSQIISLGERLQEAVAGAGNETSEPLQKPQLQQHRTKYFVKEGETLESIAQDKLGDARLVQLLITINRALVNYKLEGERKVAYVVPNQYLWLPTDHELEIHKRNFFGKHGKDGSVSRGISSKQNTPLIPPVSFDHTKEVSAEISASLQDFRPSSGSNSSNSHSGSGNRMSAGYEVKKVVPQAGAISSSSSASSQDSHNSNRLAGNIDKLRHAGNRQSVNLDEIDHASAQVSHRQCYQVREGETLMSIAATLESMGHISMWKLLAKINGFQIEAGGHGKPVEHLYAGQFIVLPTTEELNEYRLLDKLNSCSNSVSVNEKPADNAFSCVQIQKEIVTPPPPALVALAQGVGGLTTVQKLSSYTRLVFNDLPQLENCFSITVETRWNGQWKPMASYECRHGQTTRHLYNKHGEIKSMELELPPYVVKEMAREDFARNWNAYVNSFMCNAAGV